MEQVSKEMGEIIRLAVSQAQRRRGLFKSTSFRRINVSESTTDPLCGAYFLLIIMPFFRTISTTFVLLFRGWWGGGFGGCVCVRERDRENVCAWDCSGR